MAISSLIRLPLRCARSHMHYSSALRGQTRARPVMVNVARPQSTATTTSRRTLLLAADESEDSTFACDWTARHLYRPGDTLHVLHCIPEAQYDTLYALPQALPHGYVGQVVRVPRPSNSEVVQEAEKWQRRLHQQFGRRLAAAGVEHELHVLVHPAAGVTKACISRAIAKEAQVLGAEAVVVASHSHGGLSEFLLGSVARSLVEHCPMPVVVIHKPVDVHKQPTTKGVGTTSIGTACSSSSTTTVTTVADGVTTTSTTTTTVTTSKSTAEGRNIVVAVDEAAASQQAVLWAAQHLWRPGDVLHVLHVVWVLVPPTTYGLVPDGLCYTAGVMSEKEKAAELKYWHDLLQANMGKLLEPLGVPYKLEVMLDYTSDPSGATGRAVCREAASLGASALVMYSEGKSLLMEAMLGSVSTYCMHHSPAPLVLLHA